MPRFHVRDTFAIQDKTTFVLAGFILEGEVSAGMAVSIPFNDHVKLTAKIDRVEYVRRPDGDVMCLCLGCSVPDEVTLWEALNIRNRTIDVTRLF
jgi:hypothetical protein